MAKSDQSITIEINAVDKASPVLKKLAENLQGLDDEHGLRFKPVMHAQLRKGESMAQMLVPVPAPKKLSPTNAETKKKDHFIFEGYEHNLSTGEKHAVYIPREEATKAQIKGKR